MIEFDKDLTKHLGEFNSFIKTGRYDETPEGVLFPEAHVYAHGVYEHRVVDRNGHATDWVAEHNLLPTEGLTYLMSLLGAGTKLTPWYLALYAGAISPTSGWNASNFASTASEITSGTEGYSQSTRVTWTPGTAAAGAIHNTASPAEFTIVTATQLTVNGVGMLTASAKGSTSGVLLSASRFGSARLLNDTDSFQIKYTLSLTSS